MKGIRHTLLVLSTTALLAGAVAASGEVLLPPHKYQKTVAYISGGVGTDEAAAFEKASTQYPLTLEFVSNTKPRSEFVGDVQISIKDMGNHDVLTTVSAGPFVLVRLFTGEYQVSATYIGTTEQRAVKIGEMEHHRLVFQWPANRLSDSQSLRNTVTL